MVRFKPASLFSTLYQQIQRIRSLVLNGVYNVTFKCLERVISLD